MEQLIYHDTDETVYHEQLDNGLSVYLLQKKDTKKRMRRLRRGMGRLINDSKKGRNGSRYRTASPISSSIRCSNLKKGTSSKSSVVSVPLRTPLPRSRGQRTCFQRRR